MNIKYINKQNKLYLLPMGNREIRPEHVTKIANSIKKWGMMRPIVVIKTSFIDGKMRNYIADGQHLSYACQRLDIPIPFVIINREFNNWEQVISCVADFNTTSRGWTLIDFIQTWSVVIEDYKKLMHYLDVYDFDKAFTAAVLNQHSGNGFIGGGTITKVIKTGKFKIVDEKFAISVFSDLTEVFQVLGFRGNRFEIRYFCQEYYVFRRSCKNYNHNKFLIQIKKTAELYQFLDGELGKLSNFFKTLI